MDTITIVGPESAITSIPRILGFQPRESLVVLWVAHGRVVLGQRVDLVPNPDAAWAEAVVRAARHAMADEALDVWVSSSPPGADAVACLHAALDRVQIRCIASIATDGSRWFSAEAPFAHRSPMSPSLAWTGPLREDFRLEGPTHGLSPDTSLAEDVLDDVISEVVAASDVRCAGRSVQWDDAEARRVVTALMDVRVRDALLWQVCHRPARAPHMAELLADVLRRTPPSACRHLATTCAIAYWVSGDGFRASVALDRALDDHPGDALGQMLAIALEAGLPPAEWVRRTRETAYSVCRGLPEAVCAVPIPSV